MSEIFLSFSGDKSQKFAEEFKKLIKEIGLGTTFLADDDIKAGNDWLKKIYKALKDCKVGIVILTKENRDNNKWLYLEYGVLSYKVFSEHEKNLKVIPLYLDFEEKDNDWENPLPDTQSISLNSKFTNSIINLIESINKTTNNLKLTEKDKNEILKSSHIITLKDIIKTNISTESTLKKSDQQQKTISTTNCTIDKSLVAQILQHINNFITQNQCILYNHIEYNRLEKYLEEELKLNEVTLANAISYLSDKNHIIFTEEEGLDSYPIEYIRLSIQGQTVVRRRNRMK